MKILIVVINAVMCIITYVGVTELSVPNVKELKNELKVKNNVSKYN